MRISAAREGANTEAGAQAQGLRVPVSAPPCDLAPAARKRLTNLLLAKAVLDLLFVTALAAGFHYYTFYPHFTGSLDHADAGSVRGWVVDRAQPRRAVEVQLYIDGRFVASVLADQPRPDVSAAGFAPDERHGFVFALEPPRRGEHEVRVYASHTSGGGTKRTLRQIGSSLRYVSE